MGRKVSTLGEVLDRKGDDVQPTGSLAYNIENGEEGVPIGACAA